MFRGEQREFVTFTRVENEIPFLENGFRFIVDHNGEVMSFSREWYEGKLPDAAKVIDSAEAAKSGTSRLLLLCCSATCPCSDDRSVWLPSSLRTNTKRTIRNSWMQQPDNCSMRLAKRQARKTSSRWEIRMPKPRKNR